MVYITATPEQIKKVRKHSNATISVANDRNFRKNLKPAPIIQQVQVVQVFRTAQVETSDDSDNRKSRQWVEFNWHGYHGERKVSGTGSNATVFFKGVRIPVSELDVIRYSSSDECDNDFYYHISDDSRCQVSHHVEIEVAEPYEHID